MQTVSLLLRPERLMIVSDFKSATRELTNPELQSGPPAGARREGSRTFRALPLPELAVEALRAEDTRSPVRRLSERNIEPLLWMGTGRANPPPGASTPL